MSKRDWLECLMVVVVFLGLLGGYLFLPSWLTERSFCIPAGEARFTTYIISDFFRDEYPAIWYKGALYPFQDNPHHGVQPYIEIEYSEARWAETCPKE